jgi:hypothetical protein
VTFNTAVAVNVEGDRVGVYAHEPSFLLVTGAPVSANDVEEDTSARRDAGSPRTLRRDHLDRRQHPDHHAGRELA